MRLAADDVARSLRGSWHLMTRGAEALPELDLTRDGFWRSFLAFALMLVIRDKMLLLVPMALVGIAWASILAMPYVILTSVLPPRKFGIYIGVFNFFIVLPQLLVATVMGEVIRSFFPTEPVWTMLVASLVMVAAALATLRVREVG